jgi:hypothetical protein
MLGGARLHRLLKNSEGASFVSGHGFSRADKLFIFDSGEADFSPTSRPVRVFQQPVQACILQQHPRYAL